MYYYYKQELFNTRYTSEGIPVDCKIKYLSGPFINLDDLYDDLPEWMKAEGYVVESLYIPEVH